MDEKFLEVAQQIEQLQRDAALDNVRSRANERHTGSFDGLHCIESQCGEEIPLARRLLGKYRCLTCQNFKETGHY